MGREKLVSFIIGFFLGASVVSLAQMNWESMETLPKKMIAACAAGQDITKRETDGVAQFRVTFKDGEYDTITCLNEESEIGQ